MADWPEDHEGPGPKILVVVAHPDDAEFMCAGSVARWTSEGREVVYGLVTSGDKGTPDPSIAPADLAKMREKEQREVCRILGVQEVEFLRYEDGMVQNTLELRKDIVRLIRRHKPSAVVTQNPTVRWSGNYINHPDHRNVGDATLDAVFPSARDVHMFPDLALDEGLDAHIVEHLYLGMRDETADVFFDVTSTIETKLRALKAHASQMRFVQSEDGGPMQEEQEFDARISGWLKERGAAKGIPYAETFKHFRLG